MFYLHIKRIGPYKDHMVIKNEFLDVVFESFNASTYPDYPQGIGVLNDGLPDATVKNGKYLLKEKIQEGLYGGNWRVLEIVNMDGSQDVPCWRMIDGILAESTTQGANVHWRPDDKLHLNYAKSTACPTLPLEEFKDMRLSVGMTNDSFEAGRTIGVLVIEGEPTFPGPYEGVKWC